VCCGYGANDDFVWRLKSVGIQQKINCIIGDPDNTKTAQIGESPHTQVAIAFCIATSVMAGLNCWLHLAEFLCMRVYKDSFFRIFQSDIRNGLQRFFENRLVRVTPEIAAELIDAATLEKLTGLQLVEFDPDTGEYRLDDRAERFLDEMLGASEIAQADWLIGLLEELRRLIEGHQKLADTAKSNALLRRICRLMRTCLSRIQRHLEDVKTAVDYEYRAGSDYEIKLMKLQWHLERARSFGHSVTDLNNLLRNDAFFQVHQEIELLSLRSRLIRTCGRIGEALIDVYQSIEEYLNRVLREYGRARKLIQLRGLIERHEHLTSTNLEEISTKAEGPWFREFRVRTLLNPDLIDSRPDLLQRALAKAGIGDASSKAKRVRLIEQPAEELPPVIDWTNVYEVFVGQKQDLFAFLTTVKIEGRCLTEAERVDGYCAILSNEDWVENLDSRSFLVAAKEGWEYAVVKPPNLKTA